jgi:hypothetical protein
MSRVRTARIWPEPSRAVGFGRAFGAGRVGVLCGPKIRLSAGAWRGSRDPRSTPTLLARAVISFAPFRENGPVRHESRGAAPPQSKTRRDATDIAGARASVTVSPAPRISIVA